MRARRRGGRSSPCFSEYWHGKSSTISGVGAVDGLYSGCCGLYSSSSEGFGAVDGLSVVDVAGSIAVRGCHAPSGHVPEEAAHAKDEDERGGGLDAHALLLVQEVGQEGRDGAAHRPAEGGERAGRTAGWGLGPRAWVGYGPAHRIYLNPVRPVHSALV